jgi:hypothetical protein
VLFWLRIAYGIHAEAMIRPRLQREGTHASAP